MKITVPYDHYSKGFEKLLSDFPNSEYLAFMQSYDEKELILLTGFMKSGNTWLRMLLTNYNQLLLNPELSEGLTINQLNETQKHSLEKQDISSFEEGQFSIVRSHFAYQPSFDHFQILYISRNPLDTLVSKYHYLTKRDEPLRTYPDDVREQLLDIDNYVRFEIDNWITYHKAYLDHFDIHITYEELKTNPENALKNIIESIGQPIDMELIERAIKFSDFDVMKQKAAANNESSGMAKGYKGDFVRKGIVGGFEDELSSETINYVKNLLTKNNITI